jgi:hypothetical protein
MAKSDLTFRQGDAGASPRKAGALVAIHSLVNRASAPYGGVSTAVNMTAKWALVTLHNSKSVSRYLGMLG